MKRRQGFTLTELLAVMGISGLLAAVSLPSFAGVMEKGRTAKCVGNLRQWGVALQCYLQDSGGYLPRRGQGVQPVWVVDCGEDWFNALTPYLEMPPYQELVLTGQAPRPGDRSIFVCPSAKVTSDFRHFITYGMNMYLSRWDQAERIRVAQLPELSRVAFLADSPGGYASTVPSRRGYGVMPRHGGRANVLFIDGHVRTFAGDYLGCGTGPKKQPDVRWDTGIEGDSWGGSL